MHSRKFIFYGKIGAALTAQTTALIEYGKRHRGHNRRFIGVECPQMRANARQCG